jgi:hypothetical protein
VLDKVAASSPHSAELAKRAAGAEMKAQMQAELPLARAKLDRLIEARAQARVDALTEEQIAALVEQRATEKAKELHEERKRLELEAVKAELAETSAPADPPARRVDLAEQMEQECRRAERARIERELRGE